MVRSWSLGFGDDALADLAVCVSEVVGNAIRHTRAACTTTVRGREGRLRLEVADQLPFFRRTVTALPLRTGGRGLTVVGALSDVWGCHRAASGTQGKVVWFEMSATPVGPSGDTAGHAPPSADFPPAHTVR